MASSFSDKRRGLATAVYAKGASAGPALGAIVGSYLLVTVGWSHMFIIVGLLSLLFLVPWLTIVPRALDEVTSRKERIQWTTVKYLLTKRAVWGVCLGYFGFLYLYFIYITWLPTYLSKARGMSISQIAWLSSVPFLVSLCAGPLAGFIADWLIGKGYSETVVRKSAIGVGLFLGAAIIPAAFSAEAQTAAIFFVVALAGQAISATNMLALPSAIAPKGHAGLIGSFQQMRARSVVSCRRSSQACCTTRCRISRLRSCLRERCWCSPPSAFSSSFRKSNPSALPMAT